MFDKLFNRGTARTPPPAPVQLIPVHRFGQQDAMLYELERLAQRTARIETRLVRFMHHHGLDSDGNPVQPA